MNLLLIGNPNCGKTTLFNALTGDRQRIGNWPGVTVEKKTGVFELDSVGVQIMDLPGVYSLTQCDHLSQDELITAKAVLDMPVDAILNVVDACHLERHLYLSSQILELGKPVIVVLTMMDIAKQRGISIDALMLSQKLGCPVIPIQADKGLGLSALQEALKTLPSLPLPFWQVVFSPFLQDTLFQLEKQLLAEGHSPATVRYYARRVAEGQATVGQDQDLDLLLADARYQSLHELVLDVQKKKSDASEHLTARLDRIVLHRFFALPIFLGMMYLMFLFAINLGGAFQDFFDLSTDTIFVQGTAWLLQQVNAPYWLIAILAQGLGKGINTTLTFIPVIAAMFFFLALLETSGYMARAAFVVDKLMRMLGLPGKAFVPMIVGFGCNVPAIMATRTLDSEQDRLLTIMMSPFMSCSARLAIYAVFVAAFFPTGGQNVVFSLYLFGILAAVLTGFLLRRTYLKGSAAPLILELPAYHKPSLHRLLKETSMRLRFFVWRAGRLIVPTCMVLGALNAIPVGAEQQSLLALLGQGLTPLFAPMGISTDNWPATVGLLTGMLAKEVVVGTLNSLYAQIGHFSQVASTHFDFWAGIKAAFLTIPEHLSELGAAFLNPVAASAKENVLSQSVYGVMVSRFHGPIGAYAYLLFVLLYIPCVSTMAVIRQEASKKWMWLSILWSVLLAYLVAVVFYQGASLLMLWPWKKIVFGAILLLILSWGIQRFWRGHVNPIT